jgi:hypothetical protein
MAAMEYRSAEGWTGLPARSCSWAAYPITPAESLWPAKALQVKSERTNLFSSSRYSTEDGLILRTTTECGARTARAPSELNRNWLTRSSSKNYWCSSSSRLRGMNLQ